MIRPFSAVILTLFATALFARNASADPTAALSWTRLPGAESCVSLPTLARSVELRLGRPVFVASTQATLSIEGHVERSGAHRWHARFVAISSDGTSSAPRELTRTADACSALDEWLVLSLSLLIDPDAALAPSTASAVSTSPEHSASSSSPSPPPPTSSQSSSPPANEPSSSPPPPVEIASPSPSPSPPPSTHAVVIEPARPHHEVVTVLIGASLAAGLSPAVSTGVGVGALIHVAPHFSLEARATIWPSQNLQIASDRSASVMFASAGLAACPSLALGTRAILYGCGGIQAAWVHASGQGFVQSESAEQWIALLTLGGRGIVRIAGPFVVSGGLGLMIPLPRPSLSYVDSVGVSHVLYDFSPVSPTGDLAVGASF